MKVNVKLIEENRIKNGYSLQEFSEALGYKGRCTYGGKRLGHKKFTLEDIMTISKLLNLQLDDLIITEE